MLLKHGATDTMMSHFNSFEHVRGGTQDGNSTQIHLRQLRRSDLTLSSNSCNSGRQPGRLEFCAQGLSLATKTRDSVEMVRGHDG